MRSWNVILFGLLLLLGGLPAQLGASDYLLRRWTSEDGLPHDSVSAVHQARNGHLWVGTWFGAVRFDGQHFQLFDRNTTSALASDAVNAIADLPDGSVWLGTADGLVRIEGGRARRLAAADGIRGDKVWRLAASVEGELWGVTSEGFFLRRADGSFESTGRPSGVDLEKVRAMQALPGRRLRVATHRGLLAVRASPEWRTESEQPPGGPEGEWDAASFAPDGTLWVGAENGLWSLDANGWHGVPAPKDRPSGNIRRVHGANWGDALVAWGEAIFRVQPPRWQRVLSAEAGHAAQTMLWDRERNLWVGTESGGLLRLRERQFQTFGKAEGLPHDYCWSVHEGPDGTIWVGTERQIGWIRDGRAGHVPGQDGIRTVRARAVWADRGGRVWEALDKVTLYEFVGGRHVGGRDLNVGLHALYEDRDGMLWVGGDRLMRKSEEGVLEDFPAPAPELRNVRAIHQDRAGAMWFGTYGHGLFRLAAGVWRRWTAADGLPSNRVWAFHEEPNGTLWLGTESGLCRMRADRFATVAAKHGLPENLVNHLLADDHGNFWVSCNRGIYRVAHEVLHAVADGRQARAHVRLYGEREGMRSAESNGEGQPAGWKARDGKLWFPTVKGVVSLDPSVFHDDTNPPPVFVESFRANGQPMFEPDAGVGSATETMPKLSTADARGVEFHFTAVSLTAPERLRFLHRLEGFESEWQDAGQRRVASYANLAPGDYRFQVRAINHHGYTNEVGATFAFRLTPQLHQTTTFRAGLLLVALAVIGSVHGYRLRNQRRFAEQERRHALELERARIARDLHDGLGAGLSQMALLGHLSEADLSQPEAARHRLDELHIQTRAALRSLNEVVWATNAKHDTLTGLVDYLSRHAEDFLRAAHIRCRLDIPTELPDLALAGPVRQEVFMVFKEALNNVARHSRATEATLSVALDDGFVRLTLTDNGVGFDPAEASARHRTHGGNGLPNLRERVRAAGGELELVSQPGHGTSVVVRLPRPCHPK